MQTIKQFVLAAKEANPSLTTKEIAQCVFDEPELTRSWSRQAVQPYVGTVLRMAGYPTESSEWKTPTDDRNWSIYWMRCGGATYDAIAKHFGLTRERIRQICAKRRLIRCELSRKLAFARLDLPADVIRTITKFDIDRLTLSAASTTDLPSLTRAILSSSAPESDSSERSYPVDNQQSAFGLTATELEWADRLYGSPYQ